MSQTLSYEKRRGEIAHYFDRTAADAWARLTSSAPVSRIRATVRAGRDEMRGTLLGWLPDDLRGQTVLDAGCGTGALAVEAARRGAHVVAVDLSRALIDLAQSRYAQVRSEERTAGEVIFLTGDMLDASLGEFDYVVAMDSLIHYESPDVTNALETLAPRTRKGMLITFAPRTTLLAAMHALGRFFPRGDRAPSIAPVALEVLHKRIAAAERLADWRLARTHRVTSGFYISQALQLIHKITP